MIPTNSCVVGAGNVDLSKPKNERTGTAGSSAPEQERTKGKQAGMVNINNNATPSHQVEAQKTEPAAN